MVAGQYKSRESGGYSFGKEARKPSIKKRGYSDEQAATRYGRSKAAE